METEDWALIISIVSLLGSFAISIWTFRQNRRLNSINLQSDYYKKIFENYLLKDIPIAVRLIFFKPDGKLDKDYKELNKVLLEMLEDCTYFAYANNVFYEKLRESILEIDDKLVEISGTIVIDSNRQNEFIYSIHQDMQSMIKLINKHYMK